MCVCVLNAQQFDKILSSEIDTIVRWGFMFQLKNMFEGNEKFVSLIYAHSLFPLSNDCRLIRHGVRGMCCLVFYFPLSHLVSLLIILYYNFISFHFVVVVVHTFLGLAFVSIQSHTFDADLPSAFFFFGGKFVLPSFYLGMKNSHRFLVIILCFKLNRCNKRSKGNRRRKNICIENVDVVDFRNEYIAKHKWCVHQC